MQLETKFHEFFQVLLLKIVKKSYTSVCNAAKEIVVKKQKSLLFSVSNMMSQILCSKLKRSFLGWDSIRKKKKKKKGCST